MLLLTRLYKDGVPTAPALLLEGMFVALLGTGFSWWVFPAEASLLMVCLAAVATDDSMDRLMDWNRRLIIEQNVAPRRANAALTIRLLAFFLGMLAAFSIIGLALDPTVVESLFSHQVEQLGTRDFASLDLGQAHAILANNIYALLFFVVMAIPFRAGGVMLALAWNASVWGASFGLLARTWTQQGGPPLPEAWLRVMAACAPHMLFEACAYVMAGIAGVFLAKGVLKYALDSDRLVSITRTVASLLALAVGLVGVGALWEGLLTPVLVRILSGGGG